MSASLIYIVSKGSSSFYQVLLHFQANTVSIVIDVEDWNQLDVI